MKTELVQCIMISKILNGEYLIHALSGCEICTGPGTNASEMLVGPVKNVVYFQVKLIDFSGKLQSGPVKKNPKFAACIILTVYT